MYYIEITANTCICTIVMNGLGIERLDATHTGSVQYPCNTELIGRANRVEVQVMPVAIDPATLDKINAEGQIKKYPDDGFAGPEFGEILTEFSLNSTLNVLRENPLINIADMVPFTLSATFDSEDVPSFADRLLHARQIENQEMLKDWAMQFRTLLERRDIYGLYDLYEPKLTDYDIAYPLQREPDNRAWFENWMNYKIFPQRPFTDFTRDAVETRKWCDGRVWEILLKDGRPLWRTEGLDGKRTSIQVYVGMVDGRIRIVR